MSDIKNIVLDYMVNYCTIEIKCPHCNSLIQPTDIKNIPICGTDKGVVKKENYISPYYCKDCGGRIEKYVC